MKKPTNLVGFFNSRETSARSRAGVFVLRVMFVFVDGSSEEGYTVVEVRLGVV